jgi:hypothetical protein
LFGKNISVTGILFYTGYLHEIAIYLITTTLESLLRNILIRILPLSWLFSYLTTFILFLPPSVEHSEEYCVTLHLVRHPLTPQNLEIVLQLLQQNYAQIHDEQDGNPLQLYDIVQQPIKCDTTGLRSIDPQSLTAS